MGSIRVAADRRAVTPVVGIVLVVALTILLAATVAAFAFSVGDESPPREAPTTAFEFDFDAEPTGHDVLSVAPRRGDRIETSRLYVDVAGAACAGGGDDPNRRLNLEADWGLSGELTAGMTVRVTSALPASTDLCTAGGDLDLRAATVRLVWESGEGTSRQLRTWSGPDAD